MSANNGVYVLKTGNQYRVAPITSIERLYLDNIGCYHTEMQSEQIVELFGGCKFTYSAEIAFNIACAINENNHYEYNIVLLNAHKTWKEIIKEVQINE